MPEYVFSYSFEQESTGTIQVETEDLEEAMLQAYDVLVQQLESGLMFQLESLDGMDVS